MTSDRSVGALKNIGWEQRDGYWWKDGVRGKPVCPAYMARGWYGPSPLVAIWPEFKISLILHTLQVFPYERTAREFFNTRLGVAYTKDDKPTEERRKP
jgi:hypothetical protein